MYADKILKIASSQIGYNENPPNSNLTKYGKAYGWNGVPWCVIFVWWCFQQADASELFYGGNKTASCTQYIAWAKKQGQWITSGYKPGDIIFFDFDIKNNNGADHVGIVESWDGKNLISIEGNTSITSDDNGGAVMRRYNHGPSIIGAARPKYNERKEKKMSGEEIYNALVEYLEKRPIPKWGNEEYYDAIIEGITDGSRPNVFASRYETAIMISRALKNGGIEID